MKIIQEITPKKIKNIVFIEDKFKDVYKRTEYEDNTYDWEAESFDEGEVEKEDLERDYQEMLRISKIKQFKSWKSLYKEAIKHTRGDEMYWVDDVFEWLEKHFEIPKRIK